MTLLLSGLVSSSFAVAEELPDIYGSVIYSSTFKSANDYGIYKVSNSNATPSVVFNGPYALHGGVLVDGIYYASAILEGQPTVNAYEVSSGKLVASFNTTLDVMAPAGYALDPLTNQVYGITYGETQDECQFSKLTFSLTDVKVEKIASLYVEDFWLALAFDSQGQLYAVSRDNIYMYAYLNKMDKATGHYQQIGRIEGAGWLYPQYKSGACIDPETDIMYINVCPSSLTGGGQYTGYLYSVDLKSAQAKKIYQYADNAEIMGMYIPVKPTPDDAPGVCSQINPVFSDASMKGTVSVKTPQTYFDGSSPQGTVDIFVTCNGNTVGTLNLQPYNSNVTIPVDLSGYTAGFYSFTVYAMNDQGKGPSAESEKVWVGADTPASTTASLKYENGNMVVTWLPVTETVNGGYLDIDNLRYTVKRSDGSIAATGLTETIFKEFVAEPNQQTVYYYTVEAVTGSLVSAPAQTNSVTIGALKPPYFSDFENGLEGWTIINANNDQYIWEAKNGGVQIRYNPTVEMDDWLISPALQLQAGKTYSIVFSTKCYNQTEKLEVKYGTGNTVAEMTNTVMSPFEISNYQDFQLHRALIVPETDGDYFFGFHGMSDADAMVLYLRDVQITGGAVSGAPDMVTDLTATPDESGKLLCTVSFKTPTTTVDNKKLEDITKIELIRNGELIKTFVNPQIGEAISYQDTPVKSGVTTYQVVAYNEIGAGVETSTSAVVGIDIPAAPANVTLTTTQVNGQVVVNWDEVSVDINGNPLPEGSVTYSVARYYIGWIDIVTGLTSTTYSYQAVKEGQEFVQLAVFAENKAGRSNVAVSPVTPVGTPYDGIKESFANGKLGSYIWYQRAIEGGTAGLFNDNSVDEVLSQDGDNGFLGIYGENEGSGASFISGLISLKNFENPELSFGINCFTIDVWNPITISVRTQDNPEWITLIDSARVTDLCKKLGWNTVNVSLDRFKDKTIQLQISAVTEYYQFTFFDNICVGNTTSSVNKIDANTEVLIKATGDGIEILNAEGLDIRIVNVNGVTVYEGKGETIKYVALQPGIYVVKTGSKVQKVIIK